MGAPRPAAPALSLSPTPSSTLAEARAIAPLLPFAVEVPRDQETTAESEPDVVRRYDIRGPGRQLYPAYVIVVDEGELGQYYDIQGSTWTDSPLLSDPTQEIHVGSRTYSLFYDGEHLKTIAWREGGARLLDRKHAHQQPLSAADAGDRRETHPVIGTATAGSNAPATPRSFKLPPPAAPAASTLAKAGALLGFVGLVIVGLLTLSVLSRQRELRALREQVAQTMALEARQRHLNKSFTK